MYLRHTLLQVSSARLVSEGQQTKAEMVYQYLTGPRLRQRVEAIVEAFSSMQDDLDKERKVITKQWAKRSEQIDRVMGATVGNLLDIEVFSMVLDANKVIAEIRWRLSKRTKPHALTGIFESIEARVLIAYVPSYTECEIFAKAKKLALETGKSEEDVIEEWRRIKPLLRVHDTAMQQVEVIELADPKDLVYMAAQQQLGVSAIYSDDPHLERMGAPLVKGRIDDDLRDYARGSAVTIGVNIGSGLVVLPCTRAGRYFGQCRIDRHSTAEAIDNSCRSWTWLASGSW